MRINNNLMAMNTHRQLGMAQNHGAKSMEKLSSGFRINRAGDDAAGLAISEKMRGQIRGLNQASRNAQDGISLIQTAEGALSESHAILQRMRELAVQSANDTNVGIDRQEIQNEINQLTSEINRIGNTTEFNTQNLLNGEIAITDDGRAIDGDVAYDGGLSNLNLETMSPLEEGKYELLVTREVANQLADKQIGDFGDNAVSIDGSATELEANVYKVVVNHEELKAIADIDDSAELLSGSPTLVSDSDLDGDYHIQVEKTTELTVSEVDEGGITVADGATDVAGFYEIATAVVVSETNINEDNEGGSGDLITDGIISNVEIAKDSEYVIADGMEITAVQLGSEGALLTAANELADSTDVTGLTLQVNGTDVTLSEVATLGDSLDLGEAANREALRDALQVDLDNELGEGAFTVGLDGASLTIQNNDRALGEEVKIGTTVGALGFEADQEAETTYSTTDNVEMRFDLTNGDGNLLESASATFTDTAGSKNIQLGDFNFDVDNQAVYASDADPTDAGSQSDFHESTLTFGDDSLEYEVTVTRDGDEDSAQTKTIDIDATAADVDFDELDNFTVNIDGGNFTTGMNLYSNVTEEDKYTIGLHDDNTGVGDLRGDAVEIIGTPTADDLKNIQLGAAGDGLIVSFDRNAMLGLDAGDTETIEIEIGETAGFSAEIKTADGENVSGMNSYTLDSNGGTTNLGKDIEFTYTSDALDENADSQAQYFTVVEDAVSNTIELKQTVDADGFNVLNSIATQDFVRGDTVVFEGYGVSVDTSTDVNDNDDATFNIIDETIDNSLALQIGANFGQSMGVSVNDMRAAAINVSGGEGKAGETVEAKSGAVAYFTADQSVTDGTTSAGAEYALDVSTHEKASAAVDVLNDAIETVSAERSMLGAAQNRLEHTISNLDNSSENLQAAESRIRDVDMAAEMMELTKQNILQQASTAMLAQANQAPQSVLQLLG